MPLARLLLVVALTTSCAPVVKLTSGEPTPAGTQPVRLNDLAFERPAKFALRDFGNGVGLSFCVERDVRSCGSLSVVLPGDLRAEQCRDPVAVAAWLKGAMQKAPELEPATVAGLHGWLHDGKDVSFPTLVLCAPEGAWRISTFYWGPKAEGPARGAFRMFMETARFVPAG
ncbi:MAG: hypothetical protein U0229_07085 [Anaeromyxobacter sp.]